MIRKFIDRLLGKAPAGALLIDCSTIDVASARDVAGEAAAVVPAAGACGAVPPMP